LEDGVALLQYTQADYEASEQQLEQVQMIYELYTSMKGKT